MSKEIEALERLHRSATGYAMVHKKHDKEILEKVLKRNEAIKVINGINYKGQDVMLCPNCERNAGKINDRYCSHCGQKLDWVLSSE